jgi:hypothetical protein
MVVDAGKGPLSALVPRLRELEFRVFTVDSCADAAELVRGFPKLSLAVINQHFDRAGSLELLATMRQLQPHLPILWHGDAEGVGRARCEARLSSKPQAEEVSSHVDDMLDAGGYSPELLGVLVDAALAALGAFGAPCCAREPFLRASRTELADLSALIPFACRQTWGHLVVGASREVARRVYARTASPKPDPNDADLTDLLGEVCNRIIGQFMHHVGADDASAHFGVPIFIASHAGALWDMSRRPSLGFEFEGAAGPVFVELSADGLSKPSFQLTLPKDLLQWDNIILL